MCSERHTPIFGHSKTIHSETDIGKSGLHIHKYGTIANIIDYLLATVEMNFQRIRRHPTRLPTTSEVSEFIYDLIDKELPGSGKSNISIDVELPGSEESNMGNQY